MKLLYPILTSFLLFSSTSYAQESGNFKTVCGYMPEGQFSEPIEKTFYADDTYPTCPGEFLETVSTTTVTAIPDPNAPGGVTYIQQHESYQVSYVLMYELAGGY